MYTQMTTDHVTIRRWVEARHGVPAQRRAARDYGAALQIIFPEREAPSSVMPMDWTRFFEEFERDELAFVHEQDHDGEAGYYNRFVKREPHQVDPSP